MMKRIVFVLWAVAACGSSAPEGPPKQVPQQTSVPADLRACERDDECTAAGVSCNGCCLQEGVAKKHATTFDQQRRETCAGYQGPICDCEILPTRPACQAGTCVLVPVDAAR